VSQHSTQELVTTPSAEAQSVPSQPKPKRVLFVSYVPRTSDFGGAERHLLELVSRIGEPAYEVSVVCVGEDVFTERLTPGHRVKIIKWRELPKSFWKWVNLFQELKPDAAVFIYGWFWAFPRMVPVAAWVAGIRQRFAIQQLEPSPQQSPPSDSSGDRQEQLGAGERIRRVLYPLVLRLSSHFFQKILCVSHALEKTLIENFGFPPNRMMTVHNGVAISRFGPSEKNGALLRQQLGLSPDEFVLVCPARLSEQKGIDILLQAIANVRRRGVACKCIIIGEGPLDAQLQRQAKELDLSRDVFFEGFQEDVRPYLQASTAFVLLSRTEGLPLTIVEAMACNLPAIVTSVGGNAEAVLDRVTGMVVPPESPEAAAEAITYLATHRDECVRMGASARKRAIESFDIEKTMAAIKAVILN
jgi:glycosyltransferase involved in cell wall biosynthesis